MRKEKVSLNPFSDQLYTVQANNQDSDSRPNSNQKYPYHPILKIKFSVLKLLIPKSEELKILIHFVEFPKEY